jgi:hypothetical protein
MMGRKKRSPSGATKPTPVPRTKSEPRLPIVIAVILIVAAVLRVAGGANDLWLDEIWSVRVASELPSAAAAFTLHHEINHYLNTLWLHFVGPDGTAFQYRAPSLIAGVASVMVAGLIGRRYSRVTGVLAMLLVGMSYELVLFSSEARGYSMLVLCALLSFYFLDLFLDRLDWRAGMAYAASAITGVLAHPVFAGVLAAACTWSAFRLLRPSHRSVRAAVTVLSAQAAPLLVLAVLYFADLRHVVAGGGTPAGSVSGAYWVGLAWTLGAPQNSTMQAVAGVLAVACLGAGLIRLWRIGSDAWLFFVGAIVVFPIVLITVRASDLIYTRHFIVGTAFVLILLSILLGALWERGRAARALCVLAVLGFAAVNGAHLKNLVTNGRGRYRDAIRYIGEHSGRPVVMLGADHDFRIGVVLDYYLPRTRISTQVRYLKQDAWPVQGPEWVLMHKESFEPATPDAQGMTDGSGNRYDFVRTFPSAPLSGLHWFLYENRAAR